MSVHFWLDGAQEFGVIHNDFNAFMMDVASKFRTTKSATSLQCGKIGREQRFVCELVVLYLL